MSEQINSQFSGYQLSDDILAALKGLGYQTPTAIQQEVIPILLNGSNVVVKSPTGSGKTAAFAIPLCETVAWEENAPQGLILEPTRELAVQVQEEIFHIGRKKRLKVPAVFGGFPIDKQILTLKQKSHLVVGTPGRLMDHIRRGSIKLAKVDFLVIDEADLMLDMGFLEDVKEILSYLPETVKISLFSATLKPGIQKLVEAYIKNPVSIMIEAEEENRLSIEQIVYRTETEHKYQDFIRVLIQENPESCMIFCGTREMVNVLFQKMRRNRIFCGMIHGELDQRERLKTIEAFRRGGFRFLIATDVAARGIDFDDLTHVFNYDFPTGRETYVHRIGRTGRNGKTGRAISMITAEDLKMLKMVEEFTDFSLPLVDVPDKNQAAEVLFWNRQKEKPDRKPQKGQELNRGITRLSIGGGRKSKMRPGDIVGTICGIDGVKESDIGIIDIRDSLSYVEVLNGKGKMVEEKLQMKTIKGKIRKVKAVRNRS